MHPLGAHMTLAPISSSLAERLLAPRTSVGWMMCQEANKCEEFFANCKSVLDLSAKRRRFRITTAPNLLILIAESVVHADQDSGRSRLGIERTPNRTNNGIEHNVILVAEVHEVAFEES
jgi:hypothetical protein